jgi:hypothetical protein
MSMPSVYLEGINADTSMRLFAKFLPLANYRKTGEHMNPGEVSAQKAQFVSMN